MTDNLWIGLIVAMLTGGLLAAVHAFLAIRFKVDQIISGVAIKSSPLGMTSYFSSAFSASQQRSVEQLGHLQIYSDPAALQDPDHGADLL